MFQMVSMHLNGPLQEYEMIAELDHPNIVRIYDLGVSDDHAHIAMEYVPGGDLKLRIEQGVQEHEAIEFTRQIAGVLGQLHSLEFCIEI